MPCSGCARTIVQLRDEETAICDPIVQHHDEDLSMLGGDFEKEETKGLGRRERGLPQFTFGLILPYLF